MKIDQNKGAFKKVNVLCTVHKAVLLNCSFSAGAEMTEISMLIYMFYSLYALQKCITVSSNYGKVNEVKDIFRAQGIGDKNLVVICIMV